MTTGEQQFGVDVADALLLQLDGKDLSHIPDEVRRAVYTLAPFVAAVRREQAALPDVALPALHEDPIALAVGLVPGPADVLSPTRLRAARKRAKLKVTDVVAAMSSRGWEVEPDSLFDWEQTPVPLAPAILTALAETIGASADVIREPRIAVDDPLVEFDDPSVAVAITDWAAVSGRSTAALQSQVRHSVAAAAARNKTALDQAFVLKVIEVLRAADDRSR